MEDAGDLAGTKSYMSPEYILLMKRLCARRQQHDNAAQAAGELATEAMLAGNDAFGLGCVLCVLCSRGRHPFEHNIFRSIPDNILANRRPKNLKSMKIRNTLHIELIEHLIDHNANSRWSAQYIVHHSPIFAKALIAGQGLNGTLLDDLQFHERPVGTCLDQLRSAPVVPCIPDLEKCVANLRKLEQSLPVKLSLNSSVSHPMTCVCFVSYMFLICFDPYDAVDVVLIQVLCTCGVHHGVQDT